MANQKQNFLVRNRYSIAVFVLLNLACLIVVMLVVARMAYSDTGRHMGLVWNLFLAWIPFMLAYFAHLVSWRRSTLYFVIPVIAFLWLIFFPNAPYILTDLQHLGQPSAGAPLWYDVVIFIWFSWTGMLLGIVSPSLMQEIIKREMGRVAGWAFVLIVSVMTGVGLYLGRFVRLNSWDILQNPGEIASNIPEWFGDPSRRSVGFIMLYTLFFIFVYLTLYAFGHVLNEKPERR
jgi:uncharacterized membrane protein